MLIPLLGCTEVILIGIISGDDELIIVALGTVGLSKLVLSPAEVVPFGP